MAFKKQDILSAIDGSGGCITTVVNRLSASYKTWYLWLKKWPELEELMRKEHLSLVAEAEDVVIAAVRAGDVNTAKWVLGRRDPRFSEKQSTTITSSIPDSTPFDTMGALDADTREALRKIASITGGADATEDNSPTKPV